MLLTVEEYAAIRGVSPATICWFTTGPEDRPVCNVYVPEVPEVFCTAQRYVALLGCDRNAVRYRLSRGALALNENGQLGVHDSDLRWGLRYLDDTDDGDDAALSTCFLQAVERELIRLGHLKPGRLIEQQLACVARSPEWWRRQRAALKAAETAWNQDWLSSEPVSDAPLSRRRTAQRSEASQVLLHPGGATKPLGGRPRNPALAKIMSEEDCSRWTAHRIRRLRRTTPFYSYCEDC